MLSMRLSPFLRQIVLLDGATSLGFGLACCLLSHQISSLLAIPDRWVWAGGVICVIFGCIAASIGYREDPAPNGVWVVILGNLLWATLSFLSIASGWLEPNLPGMLVVVGQAVVVLVLGVLQFLAMLGRIAYGVDC